MLEGVLKAIASSNVSLSLSEVSILGMLEGVLKDECVPSLLGWTKCFNPWYVGGGVKRCGNCCHFDPPMTSFNPWYVGGGVKSADRRSVRQAERRFNPWYVGGGVKSLLYAAKHTRKCGFNPWYVGGGVKRTFNPKNCNAL